MKTLVAECKEPGDRLTTRLVRFVHGNFRTLRKGQKADWHCAEGDSPRWVRSGVFIMRQVLASGRSQVDHLRGQNLKPTELPRQCYRVNVSRTESLISRIIDVLLARIPRCAEVGDGGTGVGGTGDGAGSSTGDSAGPMPCGIAS